MKHTQLRRTLAVTSRLMLAVLFIGLPQMADAQDTRPPLDAREFVQLDPSMVPFGEDLAIHSPNLTSGAEGDSDSRVDSIRLSYLSRQHPTITVLEKYFNEAANEFDVPVILLKAIGLVENNWTMYGPTIDQGWGIMHLVENNYADTLGEAAILLNVDRQLLKDDAQQNIRASAALLRHYAGPDADADNVAEWFEAAMQFSGLISGNLRQMQAETYFRLVRDGAKASTIWGEKILVEGSPNTKIPTGPQLETSNVFQAVDYPGAESQFTTCNYATGRIHEIDTYVNHWIGKAGATYAQTISFFQTCRPDKPTSAHFVIRASDGQVAQIVRVADTAYHAGVTGYPHNNPRSIGVEHEVTVTNPDTWNSPALLRSSATLARYFVQRYQIPALRAMPGIRGHNEMPGAKTDCPGNLPWDTWMSYFALPLAPPLASGVALSGFTTNSSQQLTYNSANTWNNVPWDFSAQALGVASNWAAVLYAGASYQSSACITFDSSVSSLNSYRFSDGTQVSSRVRSIQVFKDVCPGVCSNRATAASAAGTSAAASPQGVCSTSPPPANRAPNTPSLQSPGDWHVARDGRAPTLCWSNPGDPDGDSVQFYAEVYDSAINASIWTSNTCWRPSELDGHYYGYQWRVKTKDSRGLESAGWSATWHFNIEAPDAPPAISFNTANGNGDSTITTRDRNWTFAGTASDPESQLGRIEFRCSGDGCGSQASHADGASWSHSQNDMSGQNDVYFVAYDGIGQATASRHLDLRIDLAAPATTVSLNNEANPANWPVWFTAPVQVRLDASDNATGRARAGVREVRYRVDGGGWQTQGGSAASFTVSSDGSHSVEYYAVDNVGNEEASRSVTFRMDKVPPTPPSGAVENHGVVDSQWQKDHNLPTFTWVASSDATSGVAGYEMYFGDDPNGQAVHIRPATPVQWTPLPGGVRTGAYYLRGRALDNASNRSIWTTLFNFRYDGTPPENPSSITHAAGTEAVRNDIWQRVSNVADFTWPVPRDDGSGIKGYQVYWGTDRAGTSATLISNTQYQSSIPLCGANEACVGYLRLRSIDNVDTPANDWTTAFTLRYDNAPPVAAFTFREGVTTTQTLVHLQIAATDQGSGLREMRISGDGQNWKPWEVYATERLESIPAISRQWWPVYLQVRDAVGLASEVVSHTIYLDVNAQQPRSASYRLFDHAMSAGVGEHTSPTYSGRSTVGQVVDSARANSLSYSIIGGYQAGSQAIPIVEPGHDEFTFVNGIFASGTGATTLSSAAYRMVGTAGELGLPNNETTLVSQNHQHQPGFLAAVRPVTTPTATPSPGPTPTPLPTPACAAPSVKINGDAPFTHNLSVALNLCATWATEMRVSNDKDFTGATWEPYAASKPWALTPAGQTVQPCFVYAAFKDAQGTIYTNSTMLD